MSNPNNNILKVNGIDSVSYTHLDVYKRQVLVGMILCAGVIVIRTIMDDTIKSEEDIEKYLGLSTLSVIPDRKDYINGSGKKKSKRNDAGKRKAS